MSFRCYRVSMFWLLAVASPLWAATASVRDLPAIERAGVLRVLVAADRHDLLTPAARAASADYQRLQALAKALSKGHRPLRLSFVSRPQTALPTALARGEGDLIATLDPLPSAAAVPLLAVPAGPRLRLVLVGNARGSLPRRLEQLAGRRLVVPRDAASGAALATLEAELRRQRLRPLQVEWADPTLSRTDILELTQAGIYPLTLADAELARHWQRQRPRLRIAERLPLGHERAPLWYLSPARPALAARVKTMGQTLAPAAPVVAHRTALYDPLQGETRQRLVRLRPLLERYARANGLDWPTLAALAYQESRLDPSVRDGGAAIGLLQITPQAARTVGMAEIRSAEGNVKAAARYLARLRREFFAGPHLAEDERRAFMLAAYNLGAGRVQALRAKARRQGLDGDRWFFQVAQVAGEEIGPGVVDFVARVNQCRLAYVRAEREDREGVLPARCGHAATTTAEAA